MAEDRSWMYTGRQSRKKFTPEWLEKTTEFVERAFRILPPGRQAFVLCPCARCEFRLYRSKDEIQLHLFKNGFAPGYTVWVYHGERHNPQPAKPSDDHPKENGDLNGKKDGAGGGEQASKSAQGTKKWVCARGKPPKKDQLWARAAAQGEGGPATMAEDRSWMYTGRQSMGSITPEWVEKTTEFVERAFHGVPPERQDVGMLCPCARCRNRNRRPRTKYAMQLDLGRNGFMPGYTVWVHHGEGHNPQPPNPSDDHPGEENLDGKKDGAGGVEQVSKTQGTKEWEMPLLEAYARSKLPKEDQIKWSYQKYLWEQEKIKQQQQQSAPKTLPLHTSGSPTAKPAEDEGRNVSVPEPELEDTATSTADGPAANPATTANARGVQIPAAPTARPKRKAGPPGWHSV
ncbi:uncharacterized protein LOC119309594 [Triticum dicoccoides]|uniref:uncharacterized protein LOC119309594 n=1 Tax=Triticum dicoccoides TaxID=85692 RepID=UPI001890E295|nr:uncharacterized protein LOC119309594 [Triticum dicoccoides]